MLAVVAVLAVGLAGYGLFQFNKASKKALEAIENESPALTALSQSNSLSGDYAEATALALAAWPRNMNDQRPKLTRTIGAMSKAFI